MVKTTIKKVIRFLWYTENNFFKKYEQFMSVANPIANRKTWTKPNKKNVTQHNELIEATYKMTLPAKRLFLILLLNVQTHKKVSINAICRIHAKDFAATFKIDEKNAYGDLIKANTELLTTLITVAHPSTNTIERFQVLSHVSENAGAGYVDCRFHNLMQPLIRCFNAGNFTTIKLAEYIKFKRTYTIRLFELLMTKDHVKMHRKLKITVEELKEILGCGSQKTYADFHTFNRVVLRPSIKEIQEKTDLKIELILHRRGRLIHEIEFSFERSDQLDWVKQAANIKTKKQLTSQRKKIDKAISKIGGENGKKRKTIN